MRTELESFVRPLAPKGRLLVPMTTAASLLFGAALASAAPTAVPPFCPSPVTPPVCAGRSVGDVLITLRNGSLGVIGLNPTGAGHFYVFSSAGNGGLHSVESDSEIGDIAVEPSNPLHTLVIGDVDAGGPGILELDDCGVVVDRTPPWGQFTGATFPHHTLAGSVFNGRGLAFSPTTGRLWTADDENDGGDSTIPGTPEHLLFSFPSLGGTSTPSFAIGAAPSSSPNTGTAQLAIAADERGNLYSGNGPIVKYTAASLATANPVGVALPGTVSSGLNAFNLVSDGNGSLFASQRNQDPNGGLVWKVDSVTGALTPWTTNFPAALGGGPLGQVTGLSIDAHGDLWVALAGVPDPAIFGVAKISGSTGQVLQFFPFPLENNTPGDAEITNPDGTSVFFNTGSEVWGVALLGVNLPAVRKDCALVPTVARAIDATTTTANLNPPARTDSFLSCQGAYGGSNVRNHGDVQAGTAIVVNAGAQINGARFPNSPVAATPVALPAGLVSAGSLNVSSAVVLPAGDYLYDNININNNGSLAGSGGLVRIWYRNGLNIGSSVTAAGGLAANLWFFGLAGSNPVNVNSNAHVTAVIDSPAASVSINSGAVLFGAAIGSTVTMNGGQLHYDEVLGGATCP